MMEDVVIVGAGPTGLMLACELALCGVRPLVIEKLPAPTGLSKALGIGGRAIDLLEHRGLYERFVAATPPAPSRAAFFHFGGVPLDVTRLLGRQPRFLNLLQAHVEALLAERARELAVEVRWGHELTELESCADSVTLTVNGARLETRYVVGCDGGRSAVRKLAGIAFPGADPTRLLRLGDVRLPEDFLGARGGGWSQGRAPLVPLGDGYVRVITNEPMPSGFDRHASITIDELRTSAARVFGFDLPIVEARWLSRFTNASRQAAEYRRGRVLLAGDAAHVHLPAGGPGINLGLNDAVNLGWKLAAEVRGTAPEGLLDTYHTERHPAGAQVLRLTRVQGSMLQATSDGIALREFVAQLIEDPAVLQRIVDQLQGQDVRHDMGLAGASPRVGAFAPMIPAALEATRRARGVLMVHRADANLARRAAPYAHAVDVVTDDAREPVLLRPDGFIAWEGEPALLDRALARWFSARPE